MEVVRLYQALGVVIMASTFHSSHTCDVLSDALANSKPIITLSVPSAESIMQNMEDAAQDVALLAPLVIEDFFKNTALLQAGVHQKEINLETSTDNETGFLPRV